MEMQTGVVLGTKSWGWVARVGQQKISLLPERARILENGEPRLPRPAEKRPNPKHPDAVCIFGTEQKGERLTATQWALKPN
jgi:hypothetical protein